MLTTRQKQVFDYIHTRIEAGGPSPSFREIRAALGLRSLSTVGYHVRALTRAGYLVNTKGYHGKRALEVAPQAPDTPLEIPLAGIIAAGKPIEALPDDQTVEVPPTLTGPDHYALKVQGDSMAGDGVLDGDVIILRRVDEARHREMVVALIDGEATLKRLMRRGGQVELHPANPDYPVITIAPEDDFRIQGVAIGVIRRF
ncbi:MAG: transcriptional repressor LexA [Fidelibacterota bacterium]|nr:MAG: transcriptional repressor LexA [Candidatus Neomarinimicrobiota bacterium]